MGRPGLKTSYLNKRKPFGTEMLVINKFEDIEKGMTQRNLENLDSFIQPVNSSIIELYTEETNRARLPEV